MIGDFRVTGYLLSAILAMTCYDSFAKSSAGHCQDIIDCLFDSEKNQATKELADYISQGMDMGSGLKPVDLAGQGSSFANTVKTEILTDLGDKLTGTGPHRSLGHWNLDGNIPGDYLKKIEALEAGSKQIFIDSWRDFVGSRTEAVKQVFNLSGPNSDRAARSFAAMCSDVHNMGDWTTADWRGIRTLDEIVDDYCRSGNRILGKNNGFTKAIRADVKQILAKCENMEVMKAVRKIPGGLTDAEKAAEILKVAEQLPDGGEFAKAIQTNIKGLKGEERIKEILSLPKKFTRHKVAPEVIDGIRNRQNDFYTRIGRVFGRMGFDGELRQIDWTKLKTFMSKWRVEKGIGTTAIRGAKVREVVVNGKRLKAVDVPVVTENGKMEVATEFLRKNPAKASALKNGLKTTGKQAAKGTVVKGAANISKWLATSAGQGVSAGVLSFVFHEGESIVAYSNGTMESDEFVRRSAFNAGLAVTEGTAVYLITGAMAGAPAVLTLGAVVVAGIVIEQAGEYVWYQIDREVGTFPGITVDELFFAVDEEVRNRRTVLDDLNDREKGKPSAAPIPYSNL